MGKGVHFGGWECLDLGEVAFAQHCEYTTEIFTFMSFI
jgi:hypothetical protein